MAALNTLRDLGRILLSVQEVANSLRGQADIQFPAQELLNSLRALADNPLSVQELLNKLRGLLANPDQFSLLEVVNSLRVLVDNLSSMQEHVNNLRGVMRTIFPVPELMNNVGLLADTLSSVLELVNNLCLLADILQEQVNKHWSAVQEVMKNLFETASGMALVSELDDELAKLDRRNKRIRSQLLDADDRCLIIDEHVKLWLRELDHVVLDAEDLFDLIHTRTGAFRQQDNEAATRPRQQGWSNFLPYVSVYLSSVPLWFFKRRVAKEVDAVNKRFELICKIGRDLQERRGNGMRRIVNKRFKGPNAQMLRAGLQFVGMDNDRKTVQELLRPGGAGRAGDQPENSKGKGIGSSGSTKGLPTQRHNPGVIAIIGMAGSGKTTLVQSVYEQVEGFNKKIWIYVKKEHGPERITKEMLESLGERNKYLNYDTSQRKLMGELAGKTLLLVLDNVDDSFLPCWESVRASLLSVAPESKVVVTTRSTKVPVSMDATALRLEGLSETEWLGLFETKVGNLDGHPELESKAKEIAGKFQMSPLAAKVLGSLIFEIRDADEWDNVLEEVLRDERGNLIRKTLMTTYEQLSSRLKRCFDFCAIYPEGHFLDKDELARCWTALGFMEDEKRPEAAARTCFEDLVSQSFIEQVPGTGNKVCYRMPWLMHKLARSVSTHQCLTVEKSERQMVTRMENEARHVLLHCTGVTDEDEQETLLREATRNQAHRLRTFILLRGESKVCLNRLFADLQKMRCLRVLDLSCTEICRIPSWIGELQLLSYLNLSSTLVAKLPDSVTSLRNLQTLNLNDCYQLHVLPQETSKLTNLRHLLLRLSQPRRSRLTSMPPGIGKLKGLQTLSRFVVGERTEGCGLDQLQHLNNIKGELWLSKLENVKKAEDAQKANLAAKGDIHTLTLEWSNQGDMPQDADSKAKLIRSRDSNSPTEQHFQTENSSSSSSSSSTSHVDVQGHLNLSVSKNVIEQLRPQQHLKILWIANYYGDKSPEWVSQMRFLETVRLSHCQHWESLIMLERLTQLKHLHVEGLGELADIKASDNGPDKFQPLEKLTIHNMANLESWCVYQDQMPNLKELSFLHCPKLRDFSQAPWQLQTANTGLKLLEGLVSLRLSHCPVWESLTVLEMLPQLKHLHVEQMEKVKSMKPSDSQPDKFQILETLTLLNMPNLEEWFIYEGQMPNLKELCFFQCPKLRDPRGAVPSSVMPQIKGCSFNVPS